MLKKMASACQKAWVRILIFPLPSQGASCKLFDVLESYCPHLKIGEQLLLRVVVRGG